MRLARGRGATRPGLSLLEVLTATAIFLFALIAIGRLIVLAGTLASDVHLQAQAAQMAQAKLAEVNAGVVPLNSQSDVPFDEDPEWQWSLDAEPDSSITGMYRVQVRVSRQRGGSKVESTLHQFILDPALRGSALDAAQGTTSSTTTTATTAGGTTGSASGGGN
jgi:hypothetical protein